MARDRILRALEVLVVLALAASGVLQVHSGDVITLEGGTAVHDVLVLGMTLPLLARRRNAAAVFCVVVAAAWVQYELGGGLGQPFFAVLIALYSVGAYAGWPATLVGPAAVLAQAVLVDVPRLRDGDPWDEVVPAWFVLTGLWAFGRWMRHRRDESARLAARAAAAGREAEAQARAAVADERARIARELHDLVAHSMGVIVLQSQGAQRTLDHDARRTRDALENIEAVGRNGMAELRRLLGLLTGPETTPGDEPQPSLHSVPDLVERVRSAGATVDLAVRGDVRDLPPGVELTAYRVVQEGLTNALKHAPGASVQVRVDYGRDCLEVGVSDDGGGKAPEQEKDGGHGMVGMRERVALYGGELVAGPRAEGGFAVTARLPVGTSP